MAAYFEDFEVGAAEVAVEEAGYARHGEKMLRLVVVEVERMLLLEVCFKILCGEMSPIA